MSQDTHFTPLKVILPHIHGEQDQCIARLKELLESDPALERVHVTHKGNKTGLCIHYDTERMSLDQLTSLISLSGAQIADRYQHKTLSIEGMDCASCASIIEHALSELEGVIVAKVGYASKQCRLEFNTEEITLTKIINHMKNMGYVAKELRIGGQHDHGFGEPGSWWHDNGEVVISLVAGFLLLLGWVSNFYLPILSFPAYVLSFAAGGLLTFRDSVQTLLQKRFDIDVLMIFAALGAAILGAWAEGALLLFLFSLGHALEHKAMHYAHDAVQALAKLAPQTALVIRNGMELEIGVEALHIDDQVLVKPGQTIPVDGVVIEGASSVDQSPITGESIPIDKQVEDNVFAGSINSQGLLKVKVTKLSENSTISRMVRLVLEADTQKSPTQHFTDKFVKYFVPTILFGVLALIVIPPLFFDLALKDAFYRAMAVLVAASPCALAISTPAAVLSAVACAARGGVLIKGGGHLENLGTVNAIAFDKTGTLTRGKPTVQTIIPLNNHTEASVLQLAASLEKYSDHPLAKAVVLAAQNQQLSLLDVSDVTQIIGKGIQGRYQDQPIHVGSTRLFESLSDEVQIHADQLLRAGKTLVIVRHANDWVGLIALADSIREEVPSMIQQLHRQGLKHTIMLTGDNQRVADAIASEVGIDHALANLLPEDKLAKISELETEYHRVAMVGDGINDAPALARATVGIAMGGAGTDVALEAADVSLMADDLSQLPFAIRLSRRAANVIKFNLLLALGVVVVLLVLTATGTAGIGPAIVAHEGSTLFVVLNALRLLRAK